jgi:hypothetical protein
LRERASSVTDGNCDFPAIGEIRVAGEKAIPCVRRNDKRCGNAGRSPDFFASLAGTFVALVSGWKERLLGDRIGSKKLEESGDIDAMPLCCIIPVDHSVSFAS